MAGCCRAPVTLAPARLRTRLAWVASALVLTLAWAFWTALLPGETAPALELLFLLLKSVALLPMESWPVPGRAASRQRPEKRNAARAELASARAAMENERLRPWAAEESATSTKSSSSTDAGAGAYTYLTHDDSATEPLGSPALGGSNNGSRLVSSGRNSGNSSGSGGKNGGGGGGSGGAAVGKLCAAAGHGKRALVRAALQRPEVATALTSEPEPPIANLLASPNLSSNLTLVAVPSSKPFTKPDTPAPTRATLKGSNPLTLVFPYTRKKTKVQRRVQQGARAAKELKLVFAGLVHRRQSGKVCRCQVCM